MSKPRTILCAGLIGWDTIGRTDLNIEIGGDLPGQIETNIGGVAANIAVALAHQLRGNPTFEVIALSSIGNDHKSDLLSSKLSNDYNINCDYLVRDEGSCDGYICIELKDGIFGAIASSTQLEKSCAKIFDTFVTDHKLIKNGSFSDFLIVDSNLTSKTIEYLVSDPLFNETNFIIACASPHKAKKILPLMIKRHCIVYTNLGEASAILGRNLSGSAEAADRLYQLGAKEVTVTNGEHQTSSRSSSGLVTLYPKKIDRLKSTGAGDIFLATHCLSLILDQKLSQFERLEKADRAARKEISLLRER